MEGKISEIFLNNMFECDGYTCHCEKDIENVAQECLLRPR